MSYTEMADSAFPVVPAPNVPVYAFYIGGTTPNVWTDKDIESIRARHVLPIFTRTDPAANAQADADEIIRWLHEHNYLPGETVAVDTESQVMPEYVGALDSHLSAAKFALVEYESKGPVSHNPRTSGGRWVADWTGLPHLFADSVATQYASAQMTGFPYDQSVIDDSVKLHELHAPAVHRITYAEIKSDVPELSRGDSGQAVKTVQGLLEAWEKGATGTAGIDGTYGPDTVAAVRRFQRMYGHDAAAGVCDGPTWQLLLTH